MSNAFKKLKIRFNKFRKSVTNVVEKNRRIKKFSRKIGFKILVIK